MATTLSTTDTVYTNVQMYTPQSCRYRTYNVYKNQDSYIAVILPSSFHRKRGRSFRCALSPSAAMETVDLKLVLLGQPGVGKTCLVYRYLYNTFGETISVCTHAATAIASACTGVGCRLRARDTESAVCARAQTIGASFAMKKVEDAGRPCNLGIWDTAGQERFDSLSSFYCRGARAAIICYDVTDRAPRH